MRPEDVNISKYLIAKIREGINIFSAVEMFCVIADLIGTPLIYLVCSWPSLLVNSKADRFGFIWQIFSKPVQIKPELSAWIYKWQSQIYNPTDGCRLQKSQRGKKELKHSSLLPQRRCHPDKINVNRVQYYTITLLWSTMTWQIK